jgi:hypothetical protein
MSYTLTAAELAADCAASEYAMRDCTTGLTAPDTGRSATLISGPTVNDDGSIRLHIIDWPSTNYRAIDVPADTELWQQVDIG